MNEPTITCMLIISSCMLLYIRVVYYLFKVINDNEKEKRRKYIEDTLEEKNFTPFQWNLIQKHERYIAEKNRHYIENHTGHWDEEYYQRKMKMMAKNKMN